MESLLKLIHSGGLLVLILRWGVGTGCLIATAGAGPGDVGTVEMVAHQLHSQCVDQTHNVQIRYLYH